MKSIGLSGTVGHVPGIAFDTTARAMQRVGNNCGNLVFQYAVARLIGEDVKVVGFDTSWDGADIRSKCRLLVIPSANFLREGLDFSVFVDFLERVELPLVFVGLGAQADDVGKARFDFHPSVLRLIDLIRERGAAVAVRGEFTARVLDQHGVAGHVVAGCPSNFINPSPDLPRMIAGKLGRPLGSFIAHADEPWPKKAVKAEVERRLVGWAREGRAIMVQQSVPTMIGYLRDANPFAQSDVREDFERKLAKVLMPDASLEAFRDFAATRLRTYYAVDQWLEDSSRFDFSVGLRLHGNMVAWQAGTPALWITHDSRTQELTETMALPSIPLDDFLQSCPTVEDAWRRAAFDPDRYASRRSALARTLIACMKGGGVEVSAPFLGTA